jgi:prevent-host-death family protein
MQTWQLQEAKARLSEVIRRASTEGPQAITVRGSDEAVVLSAENYHQLLGDKPSFLQFINQSPVKGVELHVQRDRSGVRRVEL